MRKTMRSMPYLALPITGLFIIAACEMVGLFSYERGEGQSLKIYFHGATQINQLPGSRETEFFNALRAATRYRIEGNRLRLAYNGGKALFFEAQN